MAAPSLNPRLVADLRDTRIQADRLRIEVSKREGEILALEEENEALRETIATLARAAGGGAVL